MKQKIDSLTERQAEVLRLLAAGHDVKSAAGLLGVSNHSVNERLREARQKLGVTSSREAARLLAEAENSGTKKIGPKKIGLGGDAPDNSGQSSSSRAPARSRGFLFGIGGVIMIVAGLFLAGITISFEAPKLQPLSPSAARKSSHVAIFSDVPLQFDGSYLVVPARLGPIRSNLIVDTAASAMVVSPEIKSALGLTDSKKAEVVGAGGTSQMEGVEIPSFSVGGLERRGVGAVVVDLARFKRRPGEPYGGLLGNDFLRGFDVELNIPAGRLRLYEHGPSPRIHGYGEANAVANQAKDAGWIEIDILVNGKPIQAIVDTAAPTSVMNWAAAKSLGISLTTPGLRRREQPTGGLGAAAAETHLFRFEDVRAGSVKLAPGDIRIADLRIFEILGKKDVPTMLFGSDMIRDRSMLVSYSGKKVYFSDPMPAANGQQGGGASARQ